MQYKLFTKEEERDLFRRWREEGDRRAYELLVESQMAWAKQRALTHIRHHFHSLDPDEAISQAYQAVLVAVDKFDPAKGRLSTLVWHAVRTRLYYCDIGGPIRVISNNRCMEQKQRALKPIRLNRHLSGKYHERTSPSACSEAMANENRRTAASLLRGLSSRERTIVWRHYALGEAYWRIGADLGISKQRVNEICLKAVRKLRAAAEDATA